MAQKKVKIGLVQMSCVASVEQNQKKALAMVEEAAKSRAQIICLPELYASLYFCQSEEQKNFKYAEKINGESFKLFAAAAKKLGVVIIVPIYEKRAAGLYHNSAMIINSKGKLIDTYRKMHIPDDPLFMEKYYFAPGDKGFFAVDTEFGRIAVLICWDQWYPEGARLAALNGAEILFYPTAIGWITADDKETHKIQHEAWETIQRSHSIANGVFVAAVNRVGREADIQFYGSSFVSNPAGKVLSRAYTNKEEVIVVECDLDEIRNQREQWPFLRDRRVDAYADISKRFVD